MFIPEFKYFKPNTIQEASRLLIDNPDSVLLAGGTDVLVEIKKGLRKAGTVISLKALNELKEISVNENEIIIGAAVTHNEIIKSSLINEKLPVLSQTALNIGTEQIRNTATIGGNLCTGASCCDMAPILLALNANVEIISHNEKNILPIHNFFLDHKKTLIKQNEILTKIFVRIPTLNSGVSFLKFGLRNAASISVASVGTMIKVLDDIITEARIAIGAVSPAPKLCSSAANLLIGINANELNKNILMQIAVDAASEALPIDDLRGTANYRREIVKTLIERSINISLNKIKNKNLTD